MDRRDEQKQEAARSEAVGWLLRLEAPQAVEADWLAFHAWLEAAPEHRDAYEQVDRVSAEFAGAAPELLRALDNRSAAAPRRRGFGRQPQRFFRAWPAATGFAATAAAAAVAVLVVGLHPPLSVPAQVYQTAKGENRAVALADGSRINLNSASRIAVRLERGARYVDLSEGEAAFDVAKDPNRPFLIAAGDRSIRVVGTEFDVLRHDGRLRVTVRRGIVAVQAPQAPAGAEPVLLRVGDQLDHQAGGPLSVVRHVDPNVAFAWRDGLLIYQDRPLAEVVGDLNRYFPTPIRVDGPAAEQRFSGMLKLDAEEDVVRRLQGFLQLSVEHRSDGFTLRAREAKR